MLGGRRWAAGSITHLVVCVFGDVVCDAVGGDVHGLLHGAAVVLSVPYMASYLSLSIRA